MQAVDTNVVIRLLTEDDPAQAAKARSIFKRREVWIAKTVVLETAWVLRSIYGFDQRRITEAMRALAALDGVRIEDALAVARALDLVDAGLDFADALHLASMGKADVFVTFDEKLVARARKLAPLAAL